MPVTVLLWGEKDNQFLRELQGRQMSLNSDVGLTQSRKGRKANQKCFFTNEVRALLFAFLKEEEWPLLCRAEERP